MSKLDDVARAIEAEYCNSGIRMEDWTGEARAALLAIREPGEDVLRRVAIAHCDVEWCKENQCCGNGHPNRQDDVDPDCLARARCAVEALVDALIGGET